MSFQDANCIQNGHSKTDPDALNGIDRNQSTLTQNDASGANLLTPVKQGHDDNFSLGGDKNRTEPSKVATDMLQGHAAEAEIPLDD